MECLECRPLKWLVKSAREQCLLIDYEMLIIKQQEVEEQEERD